VIEFSCSLAPRLKLSGLNEKYLLKRIMRDTLPEAIVKRPKQPYRAPIQACFFPGGKPLDWVAEALSPATVREAGYFDPNAVALLAAKVRRVESLGEVDSMALVGLLSTQEFHRRFVADFCAPESLTDRDDVKTVVRSPDLVRQPCSPV
jgi:asparagine synthase (glutamine-hydrolysing)